MRLHSQWPCHLLFVPRALMARMVERVEPRFGRLLSLFVGAAALTMGVSLLISGRAYEARDL